MGRGRDARATGDSFPVDPFSVPGQGCLAIFSDRSPRSSMDEQTLNALKAAYQASPDNLQLLFVLIKGLLEAGECETAYFLIEDKEPSLWPPGEDRLRAAEVCLALSDHEKALAFASEETPPALLFRARALLGLGRFAEGLQAYEKAVAANPTLEDPALAERLRSGAEPRASASAGRGPEAPGGGERPRVASISNDDTTESELVRMFVPVEGGTVRFGDVGGLDAIKEQIRKKIILPFQKPSLFQRFRKRVGGGILLYGPPGCGKTLLARATAGECEAAFYNVSISDVLDMYIGESEQRLHAIFEKARSTAPAVLFFDEIEALGGKRQYTREATSSKLVSQFLSEMDGFAQNNTGVLILGATNVPWALDPAFRRPGRFDRVLFVPPPDRPAREAVLRILLDERPVAPDVDLRYVAEKTSGFSGADLRNLVETAADEAIEESLSGGAEVPISQAHLLDALREVRPTTLEWLTTARNYARYANEAGHYDEVLQFLKQHGKS